MVVDLGSPQSVRRVEVEWNAAGAPSATVEFSRDGVHYRRAGAVRGGGRVSELTCDVLVRYVAVAVRGKAQAGVVRLSVR